MAAMPSRPAHRPRQSHHKSRNGCLTCKQRRIRCDETKPICTQCQSSLRVCTYAKQHSDAALTVHSSMSISPSISFRPESLSRTLAGPACPTNVFLLPHNVPEPRTVRIPVSFSDSDLYEHYLEHTSRIAPYQNKDQAAMQFGMTKLAEQDGTVSPSLLALSAACVCCDMIARGDIDVGRIGQVLNIGLQHHALAIKHTRNMASKPSEANAEALLASSSLLVPFAIAFQHINYWVLFNSGHASSSLHVSPRELAALLRGVRSIVVALSITKPGASAGARSQEQYHAEDATMALQTPNLSRYQASPRDHLMFRILAATARRAFAQLQLKIEIYSRISRTVQASSWILAAFGVLQGMACDCFPAAGINVSAERYAVAHPQNMDSLLGNIPSWLLYFATRDPQPMRKEPLVTTLFTFLVTSPSSYLDILLMRLDPQVENNGANSSVQQLTSTELLSLDIYAHWLVLMFLVEGETWWVGNFPTLALQELMRTYGEQLLRDGHELWWPRSMLEIMTHLMQWK